MEHPYELVDWCLDFWTDLWVPVLIFLLIPFKCIGYDAFCFSFYRYSQWLNDCLFLLIPVKENNYSATNWLTLIARTFSSYILSLYYCTRDKYFKILQVNLESVQWCLFIWCSFPKMRKPNIFWIPFRDQNANTVMTLFVHVLRTVCLYLIIFLQLKWVGSDKLLESVLCLIDIHVIANFCYYL